MLGTGRSRIQPRHFVSILAPWFACLSSQQSPADMKIAPDLYDMRYPVLNVTNLLPSGHSGKVTSVLSGVSTSVNSVIFRDSRYVRLTLSAARVYPALSCTAERANLGNFSYRHEPTNAISPVQRGECTLDIKLRVDITGLRFVVRSTVIRDVGTQIREVVNVTFSFDILSFNKSTCRRYTTRHIVQCRCLRTFTNFGVFSTVMFRPLQGSLDGCLYYTWYNHGANVVVLLVLLQKGQQCEFVCEVDLSHGAPAVKETFRRFYSVTHSPSRTEKLSQYYAHLIRTWFFLTMSGFVAFGLTLFFVHMQSRRAISNQEILKLMQARLDRSLNSDILVAETSSQESHLSNQEILKLTQARLDRSLNSDIHVAETEHLTTVGTGEERNVSEH